MVSKTKNILKYPCPTGFKSRKSLSLSLKGLHETDTWVSPPLWMTFIAFTTRKRVVVMNNPSCGMGMNARAMGPRERERESGWSRTCVKNMHTCKLKYVFRSSYLFVSKVGNDCRMKRLLRPWNKSKIQPSHPCLPVMFLRERSTFSVLE